MKDKIIKIGLLSLGVISVLIASFVNADMVGFEASQVSYSVSASSSQSFNFVVNSKSIGCVRLSSTDLNCELSGYNINLVNSISLGCVYNNDISIHSLKVNCVNNSANNSRNVYYLKFSGDIINCPNCTNMSSLECQTNYNLIPVSSVDQNYCEINNLCPSSNCPDTPINGFSNIYVNDILHPGAFNVVINIPDEIEWDYAYTGSGTNFNLDVVGYNQDTEYITSWIDTNNYKPTTDDFAHIFGGFANFGGLLIATLFIILVFYFVKKSFK